MKARKSYIINIVVAAVFIIAFVIVLVWQSGFFDKTPEVNVKANNCYSETLVVITDADYRPYSFYDDEGHISGHDVELINMIANELHMNVDLRLLDWNEAITEMEKGYADILMTCDYSDSFAGVDVLLKTEPVSSDEFVVYSKKKITSQDELYGKTIAVMKNGNVTTEVRKMQIGKYCRFYNDNREALKALINNEVDYAIMRQTVGKVLLQELGVSDVHGYLSISQSDMCFGVNSDKPELVDKINAVLEKFKINGNMEKLRNKWLTTFIHTYTLKEIIERNRWISVLGIAVLIMCMAAVLHSRYLKEKSLEEIYRTSQVIEQLAQDFECVNYVTITDDKHKDRVVNYRISQMLRDRIPGWEKEKYFTKKLDMLCDSLVYESDKKRFHDETRREYIIKSLKDSNAYFVNAMFSIDDEILYYQMKFSPVMENGNLKAFVAGLHCVDDETRKEMEYQDKLQEALSKADEANKSKTEFLFNMSHDIRTPMNAIMGFTNIAKANIDDSERVLDCIEKTQQSSTLLLSMINSILDMSRIESGKAILDESPGDVRYSFANITATMNELAKAKQINLTFEMGELYDYYVHVDYERCMRIFINIITNAIKYTKEGGYVKVSCRQVGRRDDGYGLYQYVCEDNGIGMSEEFQKHVFDRFSREENSTTRGIQGTGLGLSVVKSFVDLMHGTIEVKSTRNVGTTFTVTLPLKLQEEKDKYAYINPNNGHPEYLNAENDTTTSITFKGKKALLVEDNEFNKEIATDILEEEGIIVESANDGSVAVQLVRERGPEYYDFILMDIQMPIMGGYEATEAIRKFFPDIKIPIIALSANAFTEDREASLKAGMDAHVAKPINVGELFRVLEGFM